MGIVRTIAGAALLSAMAVGLAGPARADDLSGFYNVTRMGNITAPGNTAMMWHIDACGSGCAQIRDEYGATWDAHLVNGKWVATRHTDNAVDCRNGTFAPGTSQLSVDAGTSKMRGTIISTSDGPACGSPTPITAGTVFIYMDKA
jgi:hypothetical protein